MKREYWGRGEIIHTHEQFNTRLIVLVLYFALSSWSSFHKNLSLFSCNHFWSRNKRLSNNLHQIFCIHFAYAEFRLNVIYGKLKKQNQKKLKMVAAEDPGDNRSHHHDGCDERFDGLYYSRRCHKQSKLFKMMVFFFFSKWWFLYKSSLANLD